MWKKLVIISIAVSAFSMTAARAQQGAEEKDPFFPSADRPAVTATRPGGAGESAWGRDPFDNPLAGKAIVQKGPSSPGIRMLTGIIYSEDVRLAIFGGETYQVGSKVGDRKLVDIRRRSVVFMSAAGAKEEVFLEDFTMNR
jgi:hypothetical protein